MEASKSEIEEIRKEQFWRIVQGELVRPVYQPIISLQDGEILGYEALSRITLKDSLLNPEEFFHMAEQEDCLWKTEELCRRKSLQGAVGKEVGKKRDGKQDPLNMGYSLQILYLRSQREIPLRMRRSFGK